MRRRLVGASLALAIAAGGAAAQDCGIAVACAVAGGAYHVALPEGAPEGAVLFLHGYGGSGATEMQNAALVGEITGRGYAVLAPSGLPWRPGGPASWNVALESGQRDDLAFLDAVAADAAARFGFPRKAVVAAGFSGGGMMVWRLACDTPGRFAAYAPIAGVLWRPLPDDCAGPVRMLHVHGWADGTVPLEGRALRGGALVQGDLFASLALLRAAAGCTDDAPDGVEARGPFMLRRWSDCAPGADIVFALHPGGHGVPEGWAPLVMDWLEAPGAPLAIEDGEG